MSKFCVGRECFWPFLALMKEETEKQHLWSLLPVLASVCWITERLQRPVLSSPHDYLYRGESRWGYIHCRWGWAELGRLNSNSCSRHIKECLLPSLLGARSIPESITLHKLVWRKFRKAQGNCFCVNIFIKMFFYQFGYFQKENLYFIIFHYILID